MDIIKSSRWGRATHSQRLEKYLGKETIAGMTHAMQDWYGPPIAVQGVPGAVYANRGGDFIGRIDAGSEVSAVERLENGLQRERRARFSRFSKQQRGSFGSLSALIAASTAGKRSDYLFTKTGTAPTATSGSMDLWTNAGTPAAGAAGSAAPGGKAWSVSDASSGGPIAFTNAVSNANTSHFVTAWATANFANTLLLYDRLFSVAYAISVGGSVAVTGVPTRYTNNSFTASDSSAGNFLFPSNPTTVLAATGHNWTTSNQYTAAGGATTHAAIQTTGISACAVHQIDVAVPGWFITLAAGDVGIKALTQMASSATVATGTIDMVIGHPIAFFPTPIVNLVSIIDGVGSAFNLQFIFDNAALAFLEITKPATNATTYSGQITCVSE